MSGATVFDSTMATSAAVLLVRGYTAANESPNVVHPVIGSAVPDITIHPVQTQAGTLSLVAADDVAAQALLDVLTSPRVPLVLVQDAPTTLGVVTRFIPTGQIGAALDEETLVRWVVTVDFTEVP
jgi:hypothetical protein